MNILLRRALITTIGMALVLPVPAIVDGAAGAAAASHQHPRCDRRVAMTFDDGPSSYRTETLRTLRRERVPATFFDVGIRIAANPQFTGFQTREGHLVLNHTWSHPRLTDLPSSEIRSQVLRTEQVLDAAGSPLPFRLLRPPFGAVDDRVAATLAEFGYRYALWDVVAVDWDVATTSQQIYDTIVAGLRPGAVILMHDGPIDSAAGPAVQTALPRIIAQARRLGYCFGLLDVNGGVVAARPPSGRGAIPRVINPVPYLPLGETSGGLLPPQPYVIVSGQEAHAVPTVG
ncbi:MAG TPA: polysaccharide deacetylase family protein [Actinoplanes sp.]|jgi:peptidoglycan/xylan/chitin deacetylase (PgdA/CDA1 family)